jgi:hypothetical protein
MDKKQELKTKRIAIKNGRGEIKGYITVYWHPTCGWVTIPGGDE